MPSGIMTELQASPLVSFRLQLQGLRQFTQLKSFSTFEIKEHFPKGMSTSLELPSSISVPTSLQREKRPRAQTLTKVKMFFFEEIVTCCFLDIISNVVILNHVKVRCRS